MRCINYLHADKMAWLLTDVCATVAASVNFQMRDDVAYVSTGNGACELLALYHLVVRRH